MKISLNQTADIIHTKGESKEADRSSTKNIEHRNVSHITGGRISFKALASNVHNKNVAIPLKVSLIKKHEFIAWPESNKGNKEKEINGI